jgi:hypothetical protein
VSLTRANVEAILIRRCGRLLTAASLDGTTVNGSNADLSDPIASAVTALGGTVASRVAVADADVATVADVEALLDVAELRTLETALGNFDATNIQVGERREDLDQIRKGLEKAIERKQAQVERKYGIGLGTISAGVITLQIAEQNEATSDE